MQTNSEFKKQCINVFSKIRPNATFLSVRGYENNYSEVSNFTVCFHTKYINAVKKSKEIIKNYEPENNDQKLAKKELLESFEKTLNGNNTAYTCKDVYEPILDIDGKPIPGIRLHTTQNTIHISAMRVNKTIITPGIYPKVKSSPKTLAKKFLRAKTPLNNWLQLKLSPARFKELSVEKMKIKGDAV